MAQRRMFSPDIVNSDAFIEMPPSTQALYFQLGMKADDDGFVNPKMVMRMMGSSEDELRVLILKRFVLPFDNGVLVIKHWKVNNLVRKDWYRPTIYRDEKKSLYVKENGSYTLDSDKGTLLVNEPLTQVRLGKVRINTDLEDEVRVPDSDSEIQKTKADPNVEKAAKHFHLKCKENYDLEPSGGLVKSMGIVKRANLSLPFGAIRKMIDDWFEEDALDAADMIQITKCLSAYRIDQFKAASL